MKAPIAELGYLAFAQHVAPATRAPWPTGDGETGAVSFDRLPARVREAWEKAAQAIGTALLERIARAQGVAEARASAGDPPCRVCGCNDDRACADGCTWADVDLCTACEGTPSLIVIPDAATVREVLR